jgi:site-specific DNA-cytosine methylase
MENERSNNIFLIEGYIRKLTPIECERLQTVPDNYTDCVSDTQRYKMLGNGWTVDVIAHIFKNLKKRTNEKFSKKHI